jgi:small subunit ribosomal protein S20
LVSNRLSLDPRLWAAIKLIAKISFGGTTLANIKSQIKRNRQNEKRRLRNRNFRGAARTAVKGAHVSLAEGTDSKESVMAAISELDRAAQKGAIHRRNAARRKGRLMKQLNKAAAPSEPKAETRTSSKKTAAKKSSK